MLLKIVFAFILLGFVGISVCELSPYEWDSNIPVNNVRTFAKFLDDIYTEYKKTTKMDALKPNPLKSQSDYSDKQKRTVFNFTFVKWAAELAHFHFIKGSDSEEGVYPVWNLPYIYGKKYFDNFVHYDKSLGRKIAKKFNNQIFAKEKRIDKKVLNQILQLAFSFATRIMLSESYEENIFISSFISRWQLKSLLAALQNGNKTEENHCIFPFKLIETDENGKNHWWAQSLNPNAQNWSEYDKEQHQFIANFKFVLNLSEFKLSNYEIFKVLDAIMNELKETGNPPAVYTFMKKHFNSILSPSSETPQIEMNCALISFGRELAKRLLPYKYRKFMNYTNKSQSECGGDAHKRREHLAICEDNTPKLHSNQLEMKLFKEPLWNYARVIGFDVNECAEVLQLCDTLRTIVDAALKDPLLDETAMDNVLKMHELRVLQIYLYEFESTEKNYINLQKLVKYYKNFSFEDKQKSLKMLLITLGQIHAKYSQSANDCVLFKSSPLRHVIGTEIKRFGKVFYAILEKHSVGTVKYDERHQQLTFPESMGERIIQKLCAFLERNPITPDTDETDFDFIQLLQTVVLTGNGQMVAEGRQKIIKDKIMPINLAMYQLLFSLAFRLCTQIGAQNDAIVVEKYAPTLMSAWDRCYERLGKKLFFDYKISVVNGMVQMKMPNWNLPYFVFSKQMSELKNKKVNVAFLCKLSKYSTTPYEVIKMAQILHNLPENDQVLVRPSDQKLFVFVLKGLQKNIEDEFKRSSRDVVKNYLDRLFGNQNDDRVNFSAKGRFCILANFVMELLAKAKAADNLPKIAFIEQFEAKTIKLCIDGKGLKKENMENFGEKTMNFGKMIKLNSNLKDDIKKIIVPNFISGLEEMLKKEGSIYMNLKNDHLVEWKLLEFEFGKRGQSQKWTEIKNLLKEPAKIKEKLGKI